MGSGATTARDHVHPAVPHLPKGRKRAGVYGSTGRPGPSVCLVTSDGKPFPCRARSRLRRGGGWSPRGQPVGRVVASVLPGRDRAALGAGWTMVSARCSGRSSRLLYPAGPAPGDGRRLKPYAPTPWSRSGRRSARGSRSSVDVSARISTTCLRADCSQSCPAAGFRPTRTNVRASSWSSVSERRRFGRRESRRPSKDVPRAAEPR